MRYHIFVCLLLESILGAVEQLITLSLLKLSFANMDYCQAVNQYKDTLCGRCHLREATQNFSKGPIPFIHSVCVRYCNICVLEEQLLYAQKAAARIPELEGLLDLARETEFLKKGQTS